MHEFLFYSYIHFQSVKTYNNRTVHEYKCLFLTFVFLQIERERESGIQNLGIKENGPKVTYLIFRRGSTGESFFFHGLIDFVQFFYTGLKNLGSFVSLILLSSTRSKMAMVRLPTTNPAQKLPFFLFTSAEGKGSPLPFWGPSQSFGFSLLPLGVRRPEVTKYQHLVSPVWPTFLPNGHLFDC